MIALGFTEYIHKLSFIFKVLDFSVIEYQVVWKAKR
jgi:hypothetical protein